MKEFYWQIKDWFIAPSIKSKPELVRKAALTIDIYLLTTLMLAGFAILHFIIGFVPLQIFNTAVGIAYLLFLVLFFRKQPNFQIATWLYGIGVFTVLTVGCYFSDGIYSLGVPYYVLCIFGAYWMGSYRTGTYWAIGITLWVLFLAPVLQYFLGVPASLFPEEHLHLTAFFSYMGITVLFAMIIISYETGKQTLEQQLERSQQQLIASEKLASLGQLTAGVAHEINNPINFINGNAQALALDLTDIKSLLNDLVTVEPQPDDRPEFTQLLAKAKAIKTPFLIDEMVTLVSGIQRGSKRVSTIVKGLQTLTNQSKSEFLRNDISELLEAALTILNHKIKQKKSVL